MHYALLQWWRDRVREGRDSLVATLCNDNMNLILLRTDKGEYSPGENVYGVVYLNVEDPTAGRGITLIFKGYEYFSYDYVAEEAGRSKLEATKDYIDFHNVNIFNNQEPFALGIYCFPFKVTLPRVLPGSFQANHEGDFNWECTVEYWLQASLTDSDLTAEQSVVVQGNAGVEGQSANVEHVVRKFPFFRAINFTVKLMNAQPVTGENIRLRMIITNNSSVTINSFHIKLLRNLLLTCKNVVPGDKLNPNISRLEHRTYIQAEKGPMVVREISGNTSSMNPAMLDRVLDNILIPLTTREDGKAIPPSTKGQHIECKYGLEILVMLSNQAIVRLSLPLPCIMHKSNSTWHSWLAPDWLSKGKVLTSDSRFSVSMDNICSEAFSGMPGFQAL